jgi:dynein heavy chain
MATAAAHNLSTIRSLPAHSLFLVCAFFVLSDDEDLINTLQKSKQAAKLIEKRVAAAAKMEANINATRQSYKTVAFSASNLFFCISDLGQVDPMYQFSLEYFNRMFISAIKEADKSLDVHVRTNNIDKQFLRSLYKNVCRSLFEKDKVSWWQELCLDSR